MQAAKVKDVLIVGGGQLSLRSVRGLCLTADFVIGCDKGCQYLLDAALPIHLAVGDFDSLDTRYFKQLELQNIPLKIHLPDKDQSDLELALAEGCSRMIGDYSGQISLTCVGGGRLDFAFANSLMLLREELSGCQIRIVEDDYEIYPLRKGVPHSINTEEGQLFSIAALSDTPITIQGAKWNLNKEPIKVGSHQTLSNVAVATQISVTLDTAPGLFFKHRSTDSMN